MQKPERASLVDQTTKALIKFINADTVAIGDKMPSEAALCEEYGVSRTTIRESLRFLQALGYVELSHNRGAYILNKKAGNTLDAKRWMLAHAKEVLEVLEVRAILEPAAAALAAQRASQDECYTIVGLQSLFENTAKQEDHTAMSVYDEKFHAAIMKASHNAFLESINEVINESIRNFRGRTFTLDIKGELAIDAHRKIAEAIINKKPEAAEKCMYDHMEKNIEIMKKYLNGGKK
jgi:GntR family transcriptional repressor for pyruvate dehydrogenase complex